MVFGKLYVEGGIDPTYLALEPQASGPTGFVNPLWVDNSGNLRSEQILLQSPASSDTATLVPQALTFGTATSTIYSPNEFFNSDNSIQCNSNNGFIMNYGSAVNTTTLDLTKLEMKNNNLNDTILLQNTGSANPVINLQTTNISSNTQNAFGASVGGIGMTYTNLITTHEQKLSVSNVIGGGAVINYSNAIDTQPLAISSNQGLNITIGSGSNLIMTNLPTSDPGISGALWNNSGVLSISL
jgi:hypothetical protein